MKTPELRGGLRLPLAVYAQAGRVFSVTIGMRHRRAVFENLAFGRRAVDLLRRLRYDRGNRVYAYCLMPDHVHLVVGAAPGSSVVDFVGAWKGLCVRAFWGFGGRGTPWQESFQDRALRSEEDLRRVVLYVLRNPVRKGLVGDYRDYPLSGSLEWDVSDLWEE